MSNFTIANGTFSVRSDGGAGIGTGKPAMAGTSIVRNLTITGGNIIVMSLSVGAGIGSGYCDSGSVIVDALIIAGGNVVATGETGIGAGTCRIGNLTVHFLTISGGNVSGISIASGAGIGSGDAMDFGNSHIDRLIIVDGTVRAVSNDNGTGTGIGAGCACESSTSE